MKPGENKFNISCPIPLDEYPKVLLAHGGGGRLMNRLINDMFMASLDNDILRKRGDAAVLGDYRKRLAFTTDSYVVSPLSFPGGDIGTLAIYGTINDLAVAGAKPLYLSLGLIIEEGFPMGTLWQVVRSISTAAGTAGVAVVTGDTKVVERGKGDGIYINTSGIGIIEHEMTISPSSIEKGDIIIVNGDIGRHGMAVMAVREDLGFKGTIVSDCAPLADMTMDLMESCNSIHCMRDLTRGGLASALCEISEASEIEMEISEDNLPVSENVMSLGEILGIDPIYSACEGRLVIFLSESDALRALEIMRAHEIGSGSKIIGSVTEKSVKSGVTMKNRYGAQRMITMLSGEQLPRIC